VTRIRAITKAAVKRPPRTSAEFDGHVNELREALGRVDALADSLARSFDQRHVGGSDPDVVDRRASYLIDMTAEAAVRAFDELNRAGDALGSGVPDEDWGGGRVTEHVGDKFARPRRGGT
jgi:hypothetical protein